MCPSSLKYQWKAEIERFTGHEAVVVEGLLTTRRSLYRQQSFYTVVNYDVLHRDLEFIEAMAPDAVILDEAQRIKNWRTRTAQVVKSLKSEYALVLTGTPLENRLEELHSLVEFVDRHRLGPMFRFLHEHQVAEGESGRVVGYKNLSAIGETLAPILLRRRKAEVMSQLPERTENNYFVPMTPLQWAHHEDNRDVVVRIAARWARNGFLTESDQRRLQIALQNMRMVCDDAWLVDRENRAGAKVGEAATLLQEVLEDPSAKVVVFSQWTRMHDLLRQELEERGITYEFLHGGVPARQRRDMVARFKEDPAVRVFLSTDAGGVGLNLQAASTVVNLDLPWNPAVLEQRIARVHRIGQRRGVQVVNFVAEGTIEHGMLGVLRFKKGLFEGVLDGGADAIFMEGGALQRFMKTVEAVSDSIPRIDHEVDPEPAPQGMVPVEEDVLAPGGEAGVSDGAASADPGVAGSGTPAGAPATGDAPAKARTLAPAGTPEPVEVPTPARALGPADTLETPGDRQPSRALGPADAPTPAGPPAPAGPQAGGAEPGCRPSSQARTASPGGNGSTSTSGAEALVPVLTAGAGFLRELGGFLEAHRQPGRSLAESLVEREPDTGRSYLKVPLPEGEAVQALLSAAGPLLELLTGGGRR